MKINHYYYWFYSLKEKGLSHIYTFKKLDKIGFTGPRKPPPQQDLTWSIEQAEKHRFYSTKKLVRVTIHSFSILFEKGSKSHQATQRKEGGRR